ncbi:MAG: bifunctional 4-hydroxy-2-oxoglutarate aldolase/2-dehydro-3-deoxy-phosphogluconate aldolase [Acidobacteriota bacterium]
MDKNHPVCAEILRCRLLAVIRLDDLSQSEALAEALLEGGATIHEFTLTSPGALQAIAQSRRRGLAGVTVGVGSVTDAQQARDAIDAGAQYVVTPILDVAVIDTCRAAGVPIVCGALTPTEIFTAWKRGADFVKVHPARVGGPSYIRDVLAPMPEVRLIPSAGVTAENAAEFLRAGAVALGVGGNLVRADLVAERRWKELSDLARRFVAAVAVPRA